MVNCYIQFLKLAKTSIALTYQSKLYIFNVPEGFQRFISDYCIKMKLSPQIFFTRIDVDYMNGIFGLLLTLNFDKQIENTKLFGPKGLCDLMSAFRYSEIGGKNFNNISFHEFFGKNLYYQNKQQLADYLAEGNNFPVQDGLKLVKLDENQSLEKYEDNFLTITPIIHFSNNISYSITTNKVKGSISTDRLDQLKLSNFQKKELFTKHQIIINNQLYSEEYFREPDTEEQSVLILDIQQDTDLDQIQMPLNLKCILHINDPFSEKYQDFITKLPASDHMFCNQEIQNQYSQGLPKTKAICNYLNSLFPNNFPTYSNTYSQVAPNYLQVQSYFSYNLLPIKVAGYREISAEMIGGISKIRQIDFSKQNMQQESKSKIKIQFLGTASMRPNKYRNVSGILVDNENSALILDCGEGTFDQLQVQNNFNFQKKILVWISHVHCDHNLGITSFLQKVPNLYLFVPQIMVPWIAQLKEIYQIKNNFSMCVIPTKDYGIEQEFFNQNCPYKQFNLITVQELNQIFQMNFQYVNVEHCQQAYGFRVNFQDGTSLSYSGDTRPCKTFINLSTGVDIMIHEATFTDDLQKNAIERKHSTIREAVESAISSQAKTLILTHFSQRYCKQGTCQQQEQAAQKLANLDQAVYEQYLKKNTVIALDFLSGYMDEYPNLVELSQELNQIVE